MMISRGPKCVCDRWRGITHCRVLFMKSYETQATVYLCTWHFFHQVKIKLSPYTSYALQSIIYIYYFIYEKVIRRKALYNYVLDAFFLHNFKWSCHCIRHATQGPFWTAPSHYLNQCWYIVNWALSSNFREISIEIHTFSFKKLHLKTSSAKWRPFCFVLC